ncbi:MAG: Crp/Fnr family transcriptional regulator [candidate division WOR-3 bacterium]|jgi:CRP-like cAMP-binding protein
MGENSKIEKVLKDGEVLFREGEVGDEMYLIKSGKIKIVQKIGDEMKVLAVLSEGDFFGEMALIDGSPRSATAIAEGDTELITFDKVAFRKKIGEEPLIEYIITELSKRLRRADEQIKFLMIKGDEKRLIAFLIMKAQDEGIKQQDGSYLINIDFRYENIAPIVGMGVDKLKRLIENLEKSNLIKIYNDKIIITNLTNLEEYLKYVSLKEKYGE